MVKLNIIALLGKSKVGKSAAGTFLCSIGNGVELAFADKLKSIVGEMFGFNHEDMYTEEGKERLTKIPCFSCPACKSVHVDTLTLDGSPHCQCKLCGTIGEPAPFKAFWTPRMVLQHVGTSGFRTVDPDVWVRYVLTLARQHLEPIPPLCEQMVGGKDYAVVVDCRFRSEAEAIWKVGGEVWKIRRPSVEKQQTGFQGHASETEQDSIRDDEVQAVIMNDSTRDAFREKLAVELKRFTAKTADYGVLHGQTPVVPLET